MTSFEEQFPSLKAAPIRWEVLPDNTIKLYEFESGKSVVHPVLCFSDADVARACLDKQRVKEAIDKAFENKPSSPYKRMQVLKKELGLK